MTNLTLIWKYPGAPQPGRNCNKSEQKISPEEKLKT